MGQRVIDQFLDAVNLDEELGILNFFMSQVQKPFFETLLYSTQGSPDLLNWLTVVVNTHFNFELFTDQEKMFLDFEHELFDDSIHVLDHSLSTDVGTDLFSILTIKSPVRVDFRYVLELVIQMVIIKLQRTHCLYFLFA